MKALVIGGGIGGLTAALCLNEAAIDVEVFEKTSALTEVGAGIQLSPNGVKVLAKLGLQDEIEAIAFRPLSLDMRLGKSGARIFSIPIRERATNQYGAPYYHVHRADLLRVLEDALRKRSPGAVKLSKEFVLFTQNPEGVTVTFADGTQARGDVLVGADGIHSSVRTNLQGEIKARFTGNAAWRFIVPATPELKSLVPPSATVWVGPKRHAVTYYLRRGELINFVGVVERTSWQRESWTEEGEVSALQADYQDWARPIAALTAGIQQCFRWALFDRDPLANWSKGRATLLGDAAHAMLPFLAQGAVMGMEDAWVLSRYLASTRAVPAALQAYEAARMPRTSRVQAGARRQMGLYHKTGALEQLGTYGPMWLAGKFAPGFVNSRQDWLYAFDVTGEDAPKVVESSASRSR